MLCIGVPEQSIGSLQGFTDILSGEDYVTESTVKPVLNHLTAVVLMSSEEETNLTEDTKKGVLAYMREKYSSLEVNDLLDAATFMDLRFRMGYIDEIDKDGVIERITEEATEIVKSSQTHSILLKNLTVKLSPRLLKVTYRIQTQTHIHHVRRRSSWVPELK